MIQNNLDKKDYELLHLLQENSRMTNAELARRIDLSPPGLQKRLRKLEESGTITQYTALVDREALGYDMLCFVQVTLRRHDPEAVMAFRDAVQDMSEVLECYHQTGESDYLLKVIIHNRRHLEQFLVNTLTPAPNIDKVRTSLVLNEIKHTTAVPLHIENRFALAK